MSINFKDVPSTVFMDDYLAEVRRQHREILQAKVRKDGNEYVVLVRWYDFVDKMPRGEWVNFVANYASWRYPNYDKLVEQVQTLCDGELKIGPVGKKMTLRFSKMIYACDVAKALVDFYQPFGPICDMYDESMNIVFSLEKAYFVIYYDEKRYNLYDVKRGVSLMPQWPSKNSKEFYEELLTLLRNNAIFPTDNLITHK